jgi:3-oxoacyl-[acyl-carrier-protein] synthase-3
VVVSGDIGIGLIRTVLPDRFTEVTELPDFGLLGHDEAEFARACGIAKVGEFADMSTVDLAVRACQDLLADRPDEPDVLLMVGARAPEVLLGSDVCHVQADCKLTGAFAFTVDGLGCTGSSVAWAMARDLLLARPERDSVLITHASRPTGADRIRYPVTVIGDGAYAMTMVRGGRPVLRAHREATDGTFHDLFRVDYKQAPWYEWREECRSPDLYRFELALHSRTRLKRMVDEVLAERGLTKDDVRATLMQNVTASAFDFYRSLLGMEIHPVCAANLARYGHLGAMDVVLNLDALLRAGELDRGDHVLVLNNSPVAAWAVSLWEI